MLFAKFPGFVMCLIWVGGKRHYGKENCSPRFSGSAVF
jgi:hypothetical protein